MIILDEHTVIEFAASIDDLNKCMKLLDKNNINYSQHWDPSICENLFTPMLVAINAELICLCELIFLVNENMITKKDYEYLLNSEVSEIRIHHNLLV